MQMDKPTIREDERHGAVDENPDVTARDDGTFTIEHFVRTVGVRTDYAGSVRKRNPLPAYPWRERFGDAADPANWPSLARSCVPMLPPVAGRTWT